MRHGIFILLSLAFAAVTAGAEETLPVLKVGSEVYSNVTITSVTAKDVYFNYSKGMGNAKLKDLDPAMQKHFHYDAAQAVADQKSATAATINHAPDPNDPKAVMDDAIMRVKAIVNQPVTKVPCGPGMEWATYPDGWFHPGAEKPDFNKVDVRETRANIYDKSEYVSSKDNPGFVFIGKELEFNSATKYFYTDRALPKKKLSEAEMLEINRLYRIIGQCEQKLNAKDNPEPPAVAAATSFLSEHRSAIIGGAVVVVALLLLMRQANKNADA